MKRLVLLLVLLLAAACATLGDREVDCIAYWEPNADGSYTSVDSLTVGEFLALKADDVTKMVCDGRDVTKNRMMRTYYDYYLTLEQQGVDSLAIDSLALHWTMTEFRYRMKLGGGG